MRVLVMGAGAGPAISIIKAIEQYNDIFIYGSDIDETAAGLYLCDDYFITPSANCKNFENIILENCKKRKIDAVYCPLDVDSLALSSHKGLFKNNNIEVLCDSYEKVSLCSDKIKCLDFCLKNKIKTPLSWKNIVPTTFGNYKLIIKPSFGCGAKNHQTICSFDEFASYNFESDFICQQYIEGDEYSVDILADEKGPIYVVPRHRISVKNGQMVKGKTVKDKEIVEYSTFVAKKFKVYGASCLQCIRNDDGIYFIELNPRYGTGVNLTTESGINIPKMHLDLCMGKNIDRKIEYKEKFISRYWSEVIL